MNIPIYFHLRFWIVKTVMGITLGVVLGFFIPLDNCAKYGAIIGLLLTQVSLIMYFGGNKRGILEYAYLEYSCCHGTELGYCKNIKKANQEFLNNNEPKAIEYLKAALLIKPNDIVASIKLGQMHEAIGNGQDAIQIYESALINPLIHSQPIIKFISSEIDRVRMKGPKKKPPIPGLSYLPW